MKNTEETKNYFIKEIDQNELMIKKRKNVCMTLNCIEHFLILASAVTRCISISAFSSLLGITIGITSSVIGLKICAITLGIIKYKFIVKKKKKHDKIVLLAKTKLSGIEALISKSLIEARWICLVNNELKEYDDMKKEIKNLMISRVNQRF